MDIEIRHLRAIAALADHGSHTAAAGILHVSQPTITRAIRQLETITGAALIERGSAAPTPAGHGVIERARRILAEIDAMERDLAGSRCIRLGFAWLLPERWYRDMRIAMGSRGIDTTLGRFDDPMAALVAGDVDASLHRNPITRPPDGIAVVSIGRERRVLAVSEYDAVFPTDDPVRWEDVPRRPIVVNTVSGSTTADSLPGDGADPDVITCRNFDEWLELVASGAGIGVVPEICAQRIQHPHVRYIELHGAPDSQVLLAWRSKPPPPRSAREFVDAAVARASGALSLL